jgi:hypothetical protein
MAALIRALHFGKTLIPPLMPLKLRTGSSIYILILRKNYTGNLRPINLTTRFLIHF